MVCMPNLYVCMWPACGNFAIRKNSKRNKQDYIFDFLMSLIKWNAFCFIEELALTKM